MPILDLWEWSRLRWVGLGDGMWNPPMWNGWLEVLCIEHNMHHMKTFFISRTDNSPAKIKYYARSELSTTIYIYTYSCNVCIAGTPGTGAVDPGDAGAVCGDYQRIKHIAAVRFWNMQILRRYSEDKHVMLSYRKCAYSAL